MWPQSPGSCYEIYPFLSTLLQLHCSDQSFSTSQPGFLAPISFSSLVQFMESTVTPCLFPVLSFGSSGEEIKPAEAAADVPKAAQSQHKCSLLSLQISALCILIEAPEATREAASCSSFLVSGESGMSGRQKGKGWVCRKITSISEQGQWCKYLTNILSLQ